VVDVEALMKAQLDNWSVVIQGAWNMAILTPDWLTKNAGIEGPVQLEFPVGNPLLPVRLLFQGVRMVVLPDRLILAPSADEMPILQRMEMTARTILTTLKHTPVAAIGVNFAFEEAEPPEKVKALFRLSDSSRLADSDFIIEATELRRRLCPAGARSYVLNMNLAQANGTRVSALLNFHCDLNSSAEAAAYLDGRVNEFRVQSLKLLHDAYQLKPDEGTST
jgi:hypothetical protein